ncbi:MAG: hypothetical protein V8K32_04510 [Candidatus Electrothrix gigas]
MRKLCSFQPKTTSLPCQQFFLPHAWKKAFPISEKTFLYLVTRHRECLEKSILYRKKNIEAARGTA